MTFSFPSDSVFEQVKQSVTMLEVAERYGVEVNGAGFASCPFHSERTSSMKIYGNDRGWHCFGCGAGGDIIHFVEMLYGLNPMDAVKKIDSDFGLNLIYGNANRELERAEQNLKQEARQRFEEEYDRRVAEVQKYRMELLDYTDLMVQEHAAYAAQLMARLEYLDYWFQENPWKVYTKR